jgi:hypothetical protein
LRRLDLRAEFAGAIDERVGGVVGGRKGEVPMKVGLEAEG